MHLICTNIEVTRTNHKTNQTVLNIQRPHNACQHSNNMTNNACIILSNKKFWKSGVSSTKDWSMVFLDFSVAISSINLLCKLYMLLGIRRTKENEIRSDAQHIILSYLLKIWFNIASAVFKLFKHDFFLFF